MMRWIIESSMKFRLVVLTVAALLIVFGYQELRNMPVDALPEFSRPYVEVQTEALGLSAHEVEAFITTPLEADMLNGVAWVDEIRSESLPGLSSIVLFFKKGTPMMAARQMVQERLVSVFTLPNVSKPPAMLNPVSSTNRVLQVGLTSDEHSLIDMSVLARWTIVPRLTGIPGVASVSIWGQRKRQLQVLVDPEDLRNEGISFQQVIRTTGNALWASPLTFLEASTPGTGGWIDTPNQRLGIRHLLPITNAGDLRKVAIEGSTTKTLGDIATVIEDHQPLIGDAIVNNAPALMLVIEKFPWANTLDVTRNVEKALVALRPGLSGMELDTSFFRPATYIESAVTNITSILFVSIAILILALLTFFMDWRKALVCLLSVTVSVIAAGWVLFIQDVTINMMMIAGLLIAIVVLVDDAIVDTESIARRLLQAREDSDRKSIIKVILNGSLEMRRPLIYATIILILAVVPVLFLEGVSGAFWNSIVLSYILALVASFTVALTITPALSFVLLRNVKTKESPAFPVLRGVYDRLFSWGVRTPRPAFIVICVLALAGIIMIPIMHQGSALPDLKETDLVISLDGGAGASLQSMNRIAARASQDLREIPGVRKVSALIGRAILSDRTINVDATELWVSIYPDADYDATLEDVKEKMAGYPSLSPEVHTNLQSNVIAQLQDNEDTLTVRVYGESLLRLKEKAEEVSRVLTQVDGITGARLVNIEESAGVNIQVDLEKVKPYGLKPGDIRRQATALVSGIEVGALFEDQKVFEVRVWGTPEIRQNLSSLKTLMIETPDGQLVQLQNLADVTIEAAPSVIQREAVARFVDVVAKVGGRDMAATAEDVNTRIQAIDFPLEYRAELLSDYADRLAIQSRVRSFAIAAALLIFLLLQVYFRSWRLATAVFLTLPAAVVGAALAAFASGGSGVSLGAIIGFIAVLAIAVRHGLTLISHFRYIEDKETESAGVELVMNGMRERFAPILISSFTIALVLMPIALSGASAGMEILQPMAVVILGGLITTILLTVIGIPAMYLLFGAADKPVFETLPVSVDADPALL